MHDTRLDQAAGLRRLFREPGVRVLPVLAPEIGVARVAALAGAIAATGERVLVVDEAAQRLPDGTLPRATLADLVAGRVEFEAAANVFADRVAWLIAADGFDALAAGGVRLAHFYAALGALPEPIDVVLLRVSRAQRLARLLDREGECLLVAQASGDGLAAASRTLKLAAAAQRPVRVIVDGATHESLARRVYARIAATAERFLGVVPRSAGWLPTESTSGSHSATVASQGALEGPAGRALRRLATDLAQWRLAEFPATARMANGAPRA